MNIRCLRDVRSADTRGQEPEEQRLPKKTRYGSNKTVVTNIKLKIMDFK